MVFSKLEQMLEVDGAIKLTPRDKEICIFLQRWRYATARQLAINFGVSEKTMYARLQKLKKVRLLTLEPVLKSMPGAYRCLPRGRLLADTGLPAVEHISENTYRHTLAMVDVALQIQCQEQARILSEQELKADHGLHRFITVKGQKKTHCPDMLAYLPNGGTIAVEVELSTKNRSHLADILQWYWEHSEYQEVRYYVLNKAAAERLLRWGARKSYIKIYLLDAMELYRPDQEIFSNFGP